MVEILKALKDTPLPSILVIGGIIFLLLAFIRKVGPAETDPSQKGWMIFIGLVLLGFGISLYIIPSFSQPISLTTPMTEIPASTSSDSPVQSTETTPMPEIPTSTPSDLLVQVQQATQQPTEVTQSATQISVQPSIPLAATQTFFVTTFEVFANLSWQDTGVQIKSGDRLRIIWDGKSKWRGVNYGDFSDPLGGYIDPNPKYACQPLMPSYEAGWNALVARIGDNGASTNPFKAIPTGEGKLYLAMNDCDQQRYDNEGSVILTIEVQH